MRWPACLLPVLALAGAAGAALPAQGFWERSRLSRCSDATTSAEYARWRCDEFAPPASGIAPAPAPLPGPAYLAPAPDETVPARRAVVRRLG